MCGLLGLPPCFPPSSHGVAELIYFLLSFFYGILFGFVSGLFSVGLEWPLLCLGGSGVLSQGAGYGVLECVFFSFAETIR